jgi:hypothetical protein
VSGRVPRLIKSITLIVMVLTFGASVGATANSVRADDCLAAPDSPSPQGTRWYYRLDWATQRKCWYLRAPDRSLRRGAATAAAPLHSTPGPFGPRHSADGPSISVDPGDKASPPSRVDMLPVRPPTSEAITATVGKLVQQSMRQDASAPPPMEAPVPQASTLSQTGNEVGGPPAAPAAWRDSVPAGAKVRAEDPVAIPTDTPADSASIDAERDAGSNTRNSMATIFAVLALGVAALFVVGKNVATRRAPTILDRRGPDNQRQHDWGAGQDQCGSVDEGQLLVLALSDLGRVRNADVAFETAFEIRKRKDKLARLHQNLDRLLQSPTTA